MSESTPKHEHHEALPSPEQHELLTALSTPEKSPQHHPEADPHQLVAEARQDIAETAGSSRSVLEHLEAAEAEAPASTPASISRELKRTTLNRELKAIRRKLPARERALSRVVHQPVVRAVSETASKTVSRPSGLLGGGLVAFIGSSGYLYLAKHLGFSYNYFVFLVLFAGGFVVGLILELLVYTLMRPRQRTQD